MDTKEKWLIKHAKATNLGAKELNEVLVMNPDEARNLLAFVDVAQCMKAEGHKPKEIKEEDLHGI